jgi:hypothetical protein
MKYMAEDAIDNMDWDGGYDYYGDDDPGLFGIVLSRTNSTNTFR